MAAFNHDNCSAGTDNLSQIILTGDYESFAKIINNQILHQILCGHKSETPSDCCSCTFVRLTEIVATMKEAHVPQKSNHYDETNDVCLLDRSSYREALPSDAHNKIFSLIVEYIRRGEFDHVAMFTIKSAANKALCCNNVLVAKRIMDAVDILLETCHWFTIEDLYKFGSAGCHNAVRFLWKFKVEPQQAVEGTCFANVETFLTQFQN
jgi:hypothetical protein